MKVSELTAYQSLVFLALHEMGFQGDRIPLELIAKHSTFIKERERRRYEPIATARALLEIPLEAPPITLDAALQVWNTLITYAGLTDSEPMRDNFIHCTVGQNRLQEYRFQGALGFGGKVRCIDGLWSVYYYPEDRNAEREEIVNRTNEALAEIRG